MEGILHGKGRWHDSSELTLGGIVSDVPQSSDFLNSSSLFTYVRDRTAVELPEVEVTAALRNR